MNELKNITKLVYELLKDIPDTRNSDSYLYLKVLEKVAKQAEVPINLQEVTVPYFLCNIKKLNFPYFATVSRARRKLQAKYPDLRGDKNVEAVRELKEKAFKEYAISEV